NAVIEWADALPDARRLLREAGMKNQLGIIASGRASTEELYLVRQTVALYPATLVDIVNRTGDHDQILVSADKNPNTNGAKMLGLATGKLDEIKKGIESGRIKTLFVQGENLEKAGFDAALLKKLESLVVLDILPSPTTRIAT